MYSTSKVKTMKRTQRTLRRDHTTPSRKIPFTQGRKNGIHNQTYKSTKGRKRIRNRVTNAYERHLGTYRLSPNGVSFGKLQIRNKLRSLKFPRVTLPKWLQQSSEQREIVSKLKDIMRTIKLKRSMNVSQVMKSLQDLWKFIKAWLVKKYDYIRLSQTGNKTERFNKERYQHLLQSLDVLSQSAMKAGGELGDGLLTILKEMGDVLAFIGTHFISGLFSFMEFLLTGMGKVILMLLWVITIPIHQGNWNLSSTNTRRTRQTVKMRQARQTVKMRQARQKRAHK